MGLKGLLLGGPVGSLLEDCLSKPKKTTSKTKRKKKKGVLENVLEVLTPPCRGPFTPFPTDGPVQVDVLNGGRTPGRSLVETIFRDSVKPRVGSVVCCDLAVAFEHSGIYVGRNRIIHRDGDGFLVSVSPETFLERLNGFNPAVSIYVACYEDNQPIGGPEIARRARDAMRSPSHKKGYDLVFKNCHQFCQYCITCKSSNGPHNCSFSSLERLLKRELGLTNWRTWDYGK